MYLTPPTTSLPPWPSLIHFSSYYFASAHWWTPSSFSPQAFAHLVPSACSSSSFQDRLLAVGLPHAKSFRSLQYSLSQRPVSFIAPTTIPHDFVCVLSTRNPSRTPVLKKGGILSPKRHLEMPFWLSQRRWGRLLVFSGWRPGMLLNSPQSLAENDPGGVSTVARMRNPKKSLQELGSCSPQCPRTQNSAGHPGSVQQTQEEGMI